MVVRVYGFPMSGYTKSVLVVLKELGVPYDLVIVNLMKGEQKKPEYLEQMHPFGLVPVLVDEDGFKVFENRAIARYLVAKYGPDSGLVPKDLKKNALFEQAMSIEIFNFMFHAGNLLAEVMKPLRGLLVEPSQELVAEYRSVLEKNLAVYETILGKQKYLAGDDLTLVDLMHLPSGTMAIERGGLTGLTATPSTARWWKALSSRESWKSVQEEMQALMANM